MTTQTPDSKPRALIAMSGGVDRSLIHILCAAVGQQQPGGGIGKHKRYRKGAEVRQGRHQRTDHSLSLIHI